ncbi:MarR family winged helix-turn-helix transcriptional regulator [Demequina oxidasica]|uniref:MarR family winged helix-turn-helix transcriptional regulator n=1 Tax=Demequina oxidasica TaxID=676199 RepID=UPI0007833ABF|nr:MarR family winged helix-turn-helix transcriptional regulator [Demequina oxidasica]
MSDKITFTLHEVVAALDEAADSLLIDKYGVTGSQFVFLAVCADVEPTDVTSLARCLGVSKAAVSKRVPSMVAGGWIVTRDDPANARRVVIELSDTARELVETGGRDLDRAFTSLFDDPRAAGIDPHQLNRQLGVLTELLLEKGPFA